MGLFGPSKNERETKVAITVYLAKQTWERLADDQKRRVQDTVNTIFESMGGEPLQLFTIPSHHKWWFYATAMYRLGINPYGGDRKWELGKLDPYEFDENSESYQLALQGAEYVFDPPEKVSFL